MGGREVRLETRTEPTVATIRAFIVLAKQLSIKRIDSSEKAFFRQIV
jgi:hypothetical protein